MTDQCACRNIALLGHMHRCPLRVTATLPKPSTAPFDPVRAAFFAGWDACDDASSVQCESADKTVSEAWTIYKNGCRKA